MILQVETLGAINAGVGFHWIVDTKGLRDGDWLTACSCGKCASRDFLCDHVIKVVTSSSGIREDITEYLKPWHTVEAREDQCRNPGPAPLNLMALLDTKLELQKAGTLLNLVQPDIRLTKSGRPTPGESMRQSLDSDENCVRARSFLERLSNMCPQEAAVRDVIAGKGIKNAGGKGTKKTCSVRSPSPHAPEQTHSQGQ